MDLQVSHCHNSLSRTTIITTYKLFKTFRTQQLSIDHLQALAATSLTALATDTHAYLRRDCVTAFQRDELYLNLFILHTILYAF